MTTETPVSTLPELVTKRRAALLLGCTVRTVDRWIDRGLLIKYTDPNGRNVAVEAAGVRALAARRVPQ